MDRSAVTSRVWELAEPLVLGAGLELVDELARVSRELGDVLDAHDAVPGRYQLECSSPGLNRPLLREAHYRRAIGQQARIRTRDRVGDRRQFHGTIVDVTADGATVRDPD